MGSPEAGKAFLEAQICSQEPLDLNQAPAFDALTLHGLRGIQAFPGRVTCVLRAEQRLQNRYGTLHGGCIATIIDLVGSAALVTQSDRSGVSLNITVDYLNPGPGGQDIFIDAQVAKMGKSVAIVNVQLFSGAEEGEAEVKRGERGAARPGKKLVAQGTHIKYLAGFEGSMRQGSRELDRQSRQGLQAAAKL